jgi:acetyl-CoA C-acetyltransferase
MFEAAQKAYEDANLTPTDIDSFITASEDFWEGASIFDEYVPDQLGGVLKPVCTITADGIHALINGYMQILTGIFDVVLIEAHSKLSDVLTPMHIINFALDPILNRELNVHPYYIAGLEMNAFLYETGNTKEQCATVVKKNRKNALHNPYAAYGTNLCVDDILTSEMLFYPMNKLDLSQPADGAVVLILAAESEIRTDTPIWIKGVGWCNDAPSLETRDWSTAMYAHSAGKMAYKLAKLQPKDIDFAEICDIFSFKELQHQEALGLCKKGESGILTEQGVTERDGDMPINPSGGALGVGYTHECSGLHSLAETVIQLRNEAGRYQVPKADIGLAMSWRGIPTTSGAVVIVGR